MIQLIIGVALVWVLTAALGLPYTVSASHGDGHAEPELDAFSPEREADRSTAVYGAPDAIRSTGTDED